MDLLVKIIVTNQDGINSDYPWAMKPKRVFVLILLQQRKKYLLV